MGIWESAERRSSSTRLGREFGFEPPRRHGLDVVDTIRAMRDGSVRVFVGDGRQLRRRHPRHRRHRPRPSQRCELTVQVSTKLNRSHVVAGRQALILPCLGRTEVDRQAAGEQLVSVEDSMGAVHASRGTLTPASPHLRSEVAIVAGLARRALGPTVPRRLVGDGDGLRPDPRRGSRRSIPGSSGYNERLRRPGGFVLPHPPRDERRFPTTDGRAALHGQPARRARRSPGTACCCRRCAPTTSTTRPSTGSTTATAGSTGSAGRLRAPRRRRRAGPAATDELVDLVGAEDGGRRRAPRLHGGALPHRPRLLRRLLPRGQRAGPAGLDGPGQQHADVEVGAWSGSNRRAERCRCPAPGEGPGVARACGTPRWGRGSPATTGR